MTNGNDSEQWAVTHPAPGLRRWWEYEHDSDSGHESWGERISPGDNHQMPNIVMYRQLREASHSQHSYRDLFKVQPRHIHVDLSECM